MFEERGTVVCGFDIKASFRPHSIIGSPHNKNNLFARLDRGTISMYLLSVATDFWTTSICPKLSETHSSMPFFRRTESLSRLPASCMLRLICRDASFFNISTEVKILKN
ncbi:hypothetical protein CPC08DRAFT_507473 [Agrocybe pediades]|nr:hypothetical protein CPC08DRAFT_507473 [Agrocybe pediades]